MFYVPCIATKCDVQYSCSTTTTRPFFIILKIILKLKEECEKQWEEEESENGQPELTSLLTNVENSYLLGKSNIAVL